MKRLFVLLVVIFSFCVPAQTAFNKFQLGYTPNTALKQQNFFGLTGTNWTGFTGSYTPGLGNPAVSTADYYHQAGVAWMRPYDLTATDCGATGASIAASRGRYVWVSSSDHNDQFPWTGSQRFSVGYSNDPGVPPSRMEFIYNNFTKTSSAPVATITAKIDNGSGSAGNILTVSAVSGGVTYDSHANVSGAGVTTALITGFSTGTAGGVGTYTINGAAQLVTPAQTMTVSQANFSIYQNPFFVCNPDDASFPFYIYGEGDASGVEHEEGYIKSADLITWSSPQISHGVYTFGSTGSWSSFQRVYRSGVNSWFSLGFQSFYPGANFFGNGKWSGTSAGTLQPNGPSSIYNICIPANSSGPAGAQPCPNTSAVQFGASASPDKVTIAAQDWALGQFDTYVSGSRNGQQWVGRAPVDGSYNILSSPTWVAISPSYPGYYPGPQYLQGVNAYTEDGIIHYYAETGFPPSNGNLNGTALGKTYINSGACNQTNGTFSFTGYIDNGSGSSGNTLHVTAMPITVPVGGQIMFFTGSPAFITAQIATQGGDVATFTIGGSTQLVTSQTISVATCGGLWQQGLDWYTEIYDATAAAGGAPVGVQASCASSTASVTWTTGVLPTDTMRLYRGTTSASQTTLVGDFSGGTATDTGMSLNAVTYYKLVYLNGGTEKKNRVVSTYCSTSSSRVNAHITRALAAGADSTTCNRTVMDTVDNWLSSNNLYNNLLFGKMVQFCVIQNGSNQISKIFDIGTTRLPRGGDYTTTTTSTTYSSTGINSLPAWVNGTSSAWGYYGSGILNNIRRKTQITFFSAYKKPHAFQITPLSIGQGTGIVLWHSSGSPGTANFLLSDATQSKTATATITGLATDYHSIAGTYSSTNGLIAYADAVAGSAQTGLVIPSPDLNPSDALTGQIGSVTTNTNVLNSGSTITKWQPSTGTYVFSDSQAQFTGGADFVFDVELTPSQISSLHTLIKTTIYGL